MLVCISRNIFMLKELLPNSSMCVFFFRGIVIMMKRIMDFGTFHMETVIAKEHAFDKFTDNVRM